MTTDYHHDLHIAARLAREASALVMRYQQSDLEVELKAYDEPVTIADKEASALIVSGLREAFPDDVIISEENADDLRRLEAERVWYIDPIDGTRDFICGHDGFTVMIGLAVNHQPVAGVVMQPVTGLLFAAAGGHAWLETQDGQSRPLHVSSVTDPASVRLVASRSHRTTKIDEVKSVLGIHSEHNIGSVGLKLSLIAVGERDLYVNPSSNCKFWDTCAPEAILSAAGGKMTDVHGNPLRYDCKDIQLRNGLVASNGALHDVIMERLRSVFPRETS